MGFVSGTGRAQERVGAIAAGMRCARHRGPDDAGTWHDQDVVFGFNRLSIIDIEHSHQPLRWGPPESPDRYALVFNGEVYNYLELRELLRDTEPPITPRATVRPSSRHTTTGAHRPSRDSAGCSPS